MIKPEYYSWGAAPMRFYHVHCKLVLLACVFSIISCFSNISSVVSALNEYGYSVPGVLILIYVSIVSLLSVVLLVISANGLQRQQWFGVRAWYAAMLFPAASSVIYGCLGFSQWPEVCGSVLGILIVFFPIYVYYQKRRPLFAVSKPRTKAKPEQEQLVNPEPRQPDIFTEDGQTIMPEFAAPPIERPVEKKVLPTRPILALLVVVSVVCVASIAGNIVQWVNRQTENAELQKNVSSLKKQIEVLEKSRSDLSKTVDSLTDDVDTYRDRINDLEMPADVLLTKIGFVYEDSGYCHTYDCPLYPYEDYDTFWAHNVEYCEYIGYPRCPRCWG